MKSVMWITCCGFHFYGFFIMSISVCFLEKVKIDILYSFLYFHSWKTLFYTEHAVSLWNRVVLARRFLCQCWPFPWQKRDFHQRPSLTSRHPPPSSSSLSSSFTASKHNFFTSLATWRVSGPLHDRFRPLCSHSPRDYTQVPSNWLIFVGYLPKV